MKAARLRAAALQKAFGLYTPRARLDDDARQEDKDEGCARRRGGRRALDLLQHGKLSPAAYAYVITMTAGWRLMISVMSAMGITSSISSI